MPDHRPPLGPRDLRERRLQEAIDRGAFTDLPGAGRPLTGLERPLSAGDWAARWARRNGGDLTAALPLALALRREREQLVDAVPALAAPEQVRALVADFNARLDAGYRRPQGDPPLALAFLDLERQLERWAQARPATPVTPSPGDEPADARRRHGAAARWWRRWRRRSS